MQPGLGQRGLLAVGGESEVKREKNAHPATETVERRLTEGGSRDRRRTAGGWWRRRGGLAV